MNSNPLFNQFALNRNSPVPLYHQLLEIFHEYLGNGTWKAGDWIPPEADLAEGYNVSEITVRQALLTLTREGRLVRHRGKGTQVTEMVDYSPVVVFEQPCELFWEIEAMQVRLLETGFTSEDHLPPNPIGKTGVFYVRRLGSQHERPVVFQNIFVGRETATKIRQDEWAHASIAKILLPHYGHLTRGREVIEAIALGRYEAEILGEREGRMALLVERTLYDQNLPAFFERIIVRFGSMTFMRKYRPL